MSYQTRKNNLCYLIIFFYTKGPHFILFILKILKDEFNNEKLDSIYQFCYKIKPKMLNQITAANQPQINQFSRSLGSCGFVSHLWQYTWPGFYQSGPLGYGFPQNYVWVELPNGCMYSHGVGGLSVYLGRQAYSICWQLKKITITLTSITRAYMLRFYFFP